MSAIKAGDLVMVVKPLPCCGGAESIGRLFRVERLEIGDMQCRCGEEVCRTSIAVFDSGRRAYETDRLIRIDPPALPESVETERVVTA